MKEKKIEIQLRFCWDFLIKVEVTLEADSSANIQINVFSVTVSVLTVSHYVETI